jgi:hypothetical protein
MDANMFDQLVEACKEADSWPLNIIRKQQLNRVLENYRNRLRGDEGRLFVPTGGRVCFWEAFAGEDCECCDTSSILLTLSEYGS